MRIRAASRMGNVIAMNMIEEQKATVATTRWVSSFAVERRPGSSSK